MQPFAFSTGGPRIDIDIDQIQRENLFQSDRKFFADRGIDVGVYMPEGYLMLTKTPYEKSTGTNCDQTGVNCSDSKQDELTKLD